MFENSMAKSNDTKVAEEKRKADLLC